MATSTGLKMIGLRSTQRFLARSMSTFRPILISIEGNIGAGKSTFMESLRKLHPQWNFIDEPVGIWSKIKNDGGAVVAQFIDKLTPS
jgi:pantothenate kinase